jgi:predicted DNA-binding transcriptional regulator AlpA
MRAPRAIEKDTGPALRPPSYVSCATLARELDVSESTVNEMVRRGVLPRPIKLSAGCVRWCWNDVQVALASMKDCTDPAAADPYMMGAHNVAPASTSGR